MQSTDSVYTYAPMGNERPEEYPDGFVPDANRWSGREYARITSLQDGEPSIYGDDAPAGEPAPVDARVTTARNGTMVRYIASSSSCATSPTTRAASSCTVSGSTARSPSTPAPPAPHSIPTRSPLPSPGSTRSASAPS